MILTCSSCATRFLVDAAAIGPAGRQVRCARCQHGWFQEPAVDLPRSVPSFSGGAASGGAASPGAESPAQEAGSTPSRRPAPLRQGANLPALPDAGRRDRLGWLMLGLFVAALLAAAGLLRQQIMTAWPQTAPLYAALGINAPASSLALQEISVSQGMHAGRPALTVKGVILNQGSSTVAVPPVLVKLHNAAGRDIYTWTHQLPEKTLEAGSRIEFETSLADPPAEARNLEVTFQQAE